MFFHRMVLVVIVMFSAAPGLCNDVIDTFTTETFETRAAERGDWSFHDGVASVVSDPVLYEKYANHGPILKWSVDCSQGETDFAMYPSGCQRVVFTLNGDGHVFRISLINPEKAMSPWQKKSKSRMIAWAQKSSKTNKGESLQPQGFPSLETLDSKWTKVSVGIQGDTAVITIGKFQIEFQHEAMQREKSEITISFASGSLQVRDFEFRSNKSGS
jgi:hypothetical protein